MDNNDLIIAHFWSTKGGNKDANNMSHKSMGMEKEGKLYRITLLSSSKAEARDSWLHAPVTILESHIW